MTDTPNDWTDNDLEQLSRIAPNAGAPSERAVKVRNIIEQNISGVMFSSGQPKILVEAIGQLLDAECKAAVARRDEEWELAKQIIYADAERQVKAAEERAFKEREELRSTHLVHQFDEAFKTTREHAREICKLLGLADSENWLYVRHEVPNYIALREAEARIDEATAAKILVEGFKMVGVSPIGSLHGVGWNDSVTRIVKQIAEHIAALTEARDRIAPNDQELTRLRDLVRHQRSELHTAGLITDEEYADICFAEGKSKESVKRLEGYDEIRASIALREAEARLEVLPKLGLLPEPLASEVAKYQAALTEARDRIAKGTK